MRITRNNKLERCGETVQKREWRNGELSRPMGRVVPCLKAGHYLVDGKPTCYAHASKKALKHMLDITKN